MYTQTSFRAASMNIANGAGIKYRTADARAIQAKYIREHNFDVVGMQEVDVSVRRSFMTHTGVEATGYCETERTLRRGGKIIESRLSNGGTLVFGTSLVFDANFCDVLDGSGCDTTGNARYGNALYLGPGATLIVADVLSYGKGREPRSALYVVAEFPGSGSVVFIVTHLSVGEGDDVTESQLLELAGIVGETKPYDSPVVVLGDFNSGQAAVSKYLKPLDLQQVATEFDDDEVEIDSIDQVWVSYKHPAVRRSGGFLAPAEDASDHTYVAVADIEIWKSYGDHEDHDD